MFRTSREHVKTICLKKRLFGQLYYFLTHQPHFITKDFYYGFGDCIFTTDRNMETFKCDILNFRLNRSFSCLCVYSNSRNDVPRVAQR